MTHIPRTHIEKEQQCVCHWFQAWSPFQKDTFLHVLLDHVAPQNVDSLYSAMGALKVCDRPPTIFQCQLKLFGEWFADWTDKERNDFLVLLAVKDPLFVEQFNHEADRAKQLQ